MKEKIIDLSDSIHDILIKYPELNKVVTELGFEDLLPYSSFNTTARVYTFPKRCDQMNISIDKVIKKFESLGYIINKNVDTLDTKMTDEDMVEVLKAIIARTSRGDSMDELKTEFINIFKNVDPNDLVNAEQKLIDDGMDVNQVSKLCELHSNLCQGSNRSSNSVLKSERLMRIPGHPLNIMHRENRAILKELENIFKLFSYEEDVVVLTKELSYLKELNNHYKKKAELFYPILSSKYKISAPSTVMSKMDEEIIMAINMLSNVKVFSYPWKEKVERILDRIRDLVYKEENVFYPLVAANLTDEEWIDISNEIDNIPLCMIEKISKWNESSKKNIYIPVEEIIEFTTGKLTNHQLESILNTLPITISFIDNNDIVRYFNKGNNKLVSKPISILGQSFYLSKPNQDEAKLKNIIEEFKNGNKESVIQYVTKDQTSIVIKYIPIFDFDDSYKGFIEVMSDLSDCKKFFSN